MIKAKQFLSRSLLMTIVALLCTVQAFAQNYAAKGVVTDESGSTIIGAAVVVKGSTHGTTTDLDGKFSIDVKKGDILEVSYIGYVSQEKPALRKMTFALVEDAQTIEDVVVIGYGAVRKKEVTGAVAQVKAEDLSKQITSDLGSALQGMVSGVSVTAESSAPGAGSTILIRGVTSVSGGNTPLYVVDGVPQEGDPRISPSEVETMDILKDAASCAIYGTRGAAGVILITTKSGKEGKMKVNVDASYGIKSITSQYDLMNATEQTYFNMAWYRAQKGGAIVDENLPLDLKRMPGYFHNNTNFIDQIFIDNAAVQNYTANVSGGANGWAYSVMGGYYDQQGSMLNSGFDRFNTRANLNYNRKRVSFGASIGLSQETTSYSPGGLFLQAIKYSPTQAELEPGTYYSSGGQEQNLISDILTTFYKEDELNSNNSFANFNVNYELFKGFKVSGRLAINRTNSYRKAFTPYKEIVNTEKDNQVTSTPESSFVSMKSLNRQSMSWDFGAQYQTKIDKHKITAMATMTGEEYSYVGFTARKEGVLDNDIKVLNGASINPEATSDNDYVNKLIGTIGRVQYDWDSRYLFSASVRVDGSSKFVPENRWGVFPSASAAWNISDEPFFKPLTSVVNNFKFRTSYGTTGNQNFSPYSYAASVTSGVDFISNGNLALGTAQTSYANPAVQWETSKQLNVGVDMGFFDNRFTLTAEYYNTEKSDMLFPITLPGSTGTTSTVWLNVGNMTNSGYEVAAQYRDQIGKVKYGISGTFSTNENMITKINGEGARSAATTTGLVAGAASQSIVSYVAEGYPMGALFLFPTNGVIDTDEELAAYKELSSTAEMGDLIYVDTDEDDKILEDDDRVFMGSGLPEYEIGLNLNASYAGFDLFVNLYSALGHELVNGARATAYTYGRHKDMLGIYSPSNTDSTLPRYMGDLKADDNYRADTDMFLEDGSYMKIKNITLGYTLPKKTTDRMNISKLRFYLSAQNIFTLTNYTGLDPEIGGGIAFRGMDMGNYPSLATYSAGLNLSF